MEVVVITFRAVCPVVANEVPTMPRFWASTRDLNTILNTIVVDMDIDNNIDVQNICIELPLLEMKKHYRKNRKRVKWL
jgi:hypothetical protein